MLEDGSTLFVNVLVILKYSYLSKPFQKTFTVCFHTKATYATSLSSLRTRSDRFHQLVRIFIKILG